MALSQRAGYRRRRPRNGLAIDVGGHAALDTDQHRTGDALTANLVAVQDRPVS